jgi:hypothetical protein
VKLLGRASDLEHALELVKHDADFIVRGNLGVLLLLGRQAVLTLGRRNSKPMRRPTKCANAMPNVLPWKHRAARFPGGR